MAEVFKLAIDHIHFGKFDMGGVLYHANYFHLYEEAREKMLLENGLDYSELVKQGLHVVLTETSQKFIKPVIYGERYQLQLSVSELTNLTISFCYKLFNNADTVINLALTKHCLVRSTNNNFRVTKFPEHLTTVFSRYKENIQ